MTPRLSVVVVNYNGAGHLESCLRSLVEHPPAIPTEIVVVDNGSTDGSGAITRAFPPARLVQLPANVGFSAGTNAGIRATAGELVLLLNNDTVAPRGALDRLVERLDADPAAAIAGPRLVDGEGAAELSFGPMLSPLAEARRKVVTSLHGRGFGPVSSWVERATRREQYVDWVSGACLLVRRGVAEDVGLLDERFFLYTEDVDFCASVRARGWKVLFTPAAEIVHLRGRSRATAARQMNTAYRRSHLAFYEKHHPRLVPLLRLYLRLKGQLPAR
ncbi:MAG TPA: glycosyltransferase family 2 protein [Vicinamibacterales bacterium]|nr:glycosyltransferase family 2 protein [Vicinamibacterales bacterium]